MFIQCLPHSDLESTLQAQWQQESEHEMARQKERERALQQQLSEKKQQEERELLDKAKTDEERERLLREHEGNMTKFEESLKNEQQRQTDALDVSVCVYVGRGVLWNTSRRWLSCNLLISHS